MLAARWWPEYMGNYVTWSCICFSSHCSILSRPEVATACTTLASRSTPLHELWLEGTDGNAVDVYARRTDCEPASRPADEAPVALTSRTES